MEIVTSWMEEGIKQGREEGLVQGIEQGLVQGIEQGLVQGIEQGTERTIIRLLRKRFGAISEEMEGRIHALKEAQKEALADALLDFRDLSDAEAWLAAQP